MPAYLNELTCPNCGAPYTLPRRANEVTCDHCGSHFLVPESVRTGAYDIPDYTPLIQNSFARRPKQNKNIGKWVRWLVIFIVVVTVVPTVCGLGAAFCGVLAPFAAKLLTR